MATEETLQDSLNDDETILDHGDRARLYEFEDTYGTKYAVVTPHVEDDGNDETEGRKRREYGDERRARIAFEVEEQKRHGTEVPVEYINDGKPAVAAYLYLDALEDSRGYGRRKKTRAYEVVADKMDTSKQTVKNYVARYLKG